MSELAAPPLVMIDGPDGRAIATRFRPAAQPGGAVFVFLPGYASDMEGGKAVALDGWCGARGLGCLRLDYSGTGASPGAFEDGTLAGWIDDARAAIAARVDESAPLILAGSSMGGWIMLHLAERLGARIRGLLGIAAAPDFTDWGFTAEQKAILQREGRLEEDNPYGLEPFVTSHVFWASGEANRLLDRAIAFDGPVRLVHGDADADVPIAIAARLMRAVQSRDVQLRLIKEGGHRLSEPHEIAAILGEASALVESL